MTTPPKKPLPVWPIIFVAAFIFGAILWLAWMSHAITQTRDSRTQPFFVPMTTNPSPARTP